MLIITVTVSSNTFCANVVHRFKQIIVLQKYPHLPKDLPILRGQHPLLFKSLGAINLDKYAYVGSYSDCSIYYSLISHYRNSNTTALF